MQKAYEVPHTAWTLSAGAFTLEKKVFQFSTHTDIYLWWMERKKVYKFPKMALGCTGKVC